MSGKNSMVLPHTTSTEAKAFDCISFPSSLQHICSWKMGCMRVSSVFCLYKVQLATNISLPISWRQVEKMLKILDKLSKRKTISWEQRNEQLSSSSKAMKSLHKKYVFVFSLVLSLSIHSLLLAWGRRSDPKKEIKKKIVLFSSIILFFDFCSRYW